MAHATWPHAANTDCPPTRWPESPRVVLQIGQGRRLRRPRGEGHLHLRRVHTLSNASHLCGLSSIMLALITSDRSPCSKFGLSSNILALITSDRGPCGKYVLSFSVLARITSGCGCKQSCPSSSLSSRSAHLCLSLGLGVQTGWPPSPACLLRLHVCLLLPPASVLHPP